MDMQFSLLSLFRLYSWPQDAGSLADPIPETSAINAAYQLLCSIRATPGGLFHEWK